MQGFAFKTMMIGILTLISALVLNTRTFAAAACLSCHRGEATQAEAPVNSTPNTTSTTKP